MRVSSTSSFQLGRSIHAKCSVLASALCLLGCPMKVLARAMDGAASANRADAAAAGGGGGQEKLQPVDKVRQAGCSKVSWFAQ